MTDKSLLEKYNYDSFIPDNFLQWMNFKESPKSGSPAPDFPLWGLDRKEISLSEILKQNLLTIVEFGSFT